MHVDTNAPPLVGNAKNDVESQLDQQNRASIPGRAGPLDENVDAWASPDKEIAAGCANEMGLVEDMEIRDRNDYAGKLWDKITGGDGTADGEKLTENMKREGTADVQINGASTMKLD